MFLIFPIYNVCNKSRIRFLSDMGLSHRISEIKIGVGAVPAGVVPPPFRDTLERDPGLEYDGKRHLVRIKS